MAAAHVRAAVNPGGWSKRQPDASHFGDRNISRKASGRPEAKQPVDTTLRCSHVLHKGERAMSKNIRSAAEVNRELKRRGFAEKLTQGRGYCYFREGDASGWWTSSVPVCYTTDLTLERWLEEHAALRNDIRNCNI
jgi:hypothetical protein